MPRITLTKEEISILAHLTRNFADYMFLDDRPDHGMGILKQYREYNKEPKPEYIKLFLSAMIKLNRSARRLQNVTNK